MQYTSATRNTTHPRSKQDLFKFHFINFTKYIKWKTTILLNAIELTYTSTTSTLNKTSYKLAICITNTLRNKTFSIFHKITGPFQHLVSLREDIPPKKADRNVRWNVCPHAAYTFNKRLKNECMYTLHINVQSYYS